MSMIDIGNGQFRVEYDGTIRVNNMVAYRPHDINEIRNFVYSLDARLNNIENTLKEFRGINEKYEALVNILIRNGIINDNNDIAEMIEAKKVINSLNTEE